MIATRLDEIVRDYVEQVGNIREELGTEKVRREMAEVALRDGMAEARRRRLEAEEERDKLRWELAAIRAGRELPKGAEATLGKAEPRPEFPGSQTAPRPPQRTILRDLTRRIFRR